MCEMSVYGGGCGNVCVGCGVWSGDRVVGVGC